MSEIARDDLVILLRKYFGFRGQQNFELADFVIPTFDLRAEDPPFHTKRGGVASAGVTAAAGQFATVGLQFPTGSPPDAVAVVRAIIPVDQGASGIIRIGTLPGVGALAALANVGTPGSWQADQPLLQVGVVSSVVSNLADKESLAVVAPTAGQTPVVITLPFVIRPNINQVVVQHSVPARNLQVAFYWDEYNVG